MKLRLILCGVCCGLALFSTPVDARVSQEEANKLGNELTPMGAIKAGNAEGTIPAWEGGLTTAPAGYREGQHHVDPYADDAVLFTITASNVQQYRDKLSPGQLAMFEKYPSTWKMNVYPSRRSFALPADIYPFVKQNATSATLAPGGNGVLGSTTAQPFPIPQNGLEALWNALLAWLPVNFSRVQAQAVPTAGGSYIIAKFYERVHGPYRKKGATIESTNNIFQLFYQEVQEPAFSAGAKIVVHDTINQAEQPRSAWSYSTGTRRVRRAPNVAFDNPGTAAEGQRTNDDFAVFNGSPERYNWELKGRKEMYIAYNSYRLGSRELSYADILQPGHINQDHARYELHRVWVVEATLKSGQSHLYPRRTFYLDEDSWGIAAAEAYDSQGNIWRVHDNHAIINYEVPVAFTVGHAIYDLNNGRYVMMQMINEQEPVNFNANFNPSDFSPASLRRSGRR